MCESDGEWWEHRPGLGWDLEEKLLPGTEMGGQLCSRALIYTARSFCAPEPLGMQSWMIL